MRRIIVPILSFLVLLMLSGSTAAALGSYVSGSVGEDVSFPNCNETIGQSSFGIVGVTDGLGFSQNPCLSQEASNFSSSNLSLYVNTGYPGKNYGLKYQNFPMACTKSDLSCLAYNYGYNAGEYALRAANAANAKSATWWLDVETANSWTNQSAQNRQSLLGEFNALSQGGVLTVGVYSTTTQWNGITGTWHNAWPSWGATTWTTRQQAATYCSGHEFTGGPSLLMQFVSGPLDQDYAC
jgi:hypothetical protein